MPLPGWDFWRDNESFWDYVTRRQRIEGRYAQGSGLPAPSGEGQAIEDYIPWMRWMESFGTLGYIAAYVTGIPMVPVVCLLLQAWFLVRIVLVLVAVVVGVWLAGLVWESIRFFFPVLYHSLEATRSAGLQMGVAAGGAILLVAVLWRLLRFIPGGVLKMILVEGLVFVSLAMALHALGGPTLPQAMNAAGQEFRPTVRTIRPR